jgi:cytoskeletal protein CcmA (bactofilin family)
VEGAGAATAGWSRAKAGCLLYEFWSTRSKKELALFSKEPEKPKSTEALKPTMPTASGVTFLAATDEARAYLDKGSKIMGKLFFEGPVRIDGQVDGEISANDVVVIGESAVVTAPLIAASVVIAGKLNGNIVASRRIEIRATAKVLGNLTTAVLVVHDGALFEGHCTMNARVKEDRKVTPIVAKEERVVLHTAVAGNKPDSQ